MSEMWDQQIKEVMNLAIIWVGCTVLIFLLLTGLDKLKEAQMSKYTPGPWVVGHDNNGAPFVGTTPRPRPDSWSEIEAGSLISEVYSGDTNPFTLGANEKGEANAVLIAAAPDLLKSCIELREGLMAAMRVIARNNHHKEFIDEIEAIGIKDDIGVRAKSVIDRAEGAFNVSDSK